jgi:hypothetical protein
MQKKLRIFFTIFGLFSFYKIIHSYGFDLILEEVSRSGFLLLALALTFIPTLICYALSWLLVSNHQNMKGNLSFIKKLMIFSKYTTASIAWNNLTPFLKVGGEPLKYFMLTKYFSHRDAINSTVNYNILHLLSTLLSFILGSFLMVILFPVPKIFYYFPFMLLFLVSLILFLVVKNFHILKKF